MRITSGQLGGRKLLTPKGTRTRPTTDRTRQAVFNILEHAHWAPALADIRVLDLFAGSGALGFEALSRGAAFCLFVEQDATARAAIRDNIEAFQLFGQTRIHRRSATALGSKPASTGAAFDLIFLDPPYAQGLGELALAEIYRHAWASKDAICVFECASDETPNLPEFTQLDSRVWGTSKVFFLQKREA